MYGQQNIKFTAHYLVSSFFLPFIRPVLSLPSVSLSFLPFSFLTLLLIRCCRSDLTFIIQSIPESCINSLLLHFCFASVLTWQQTYPAAISARSLKQLTSFKSSKSTEIFRISITYLNDLADQTCHVIQETYISVGLGAYHKEAQVCVNDSVGYLKQNHL